LQNLWHLALPFTVMAAHCRAAPAATAPSVAMEWGQQELATNRSAGYGISLGDRACGLLAMNGLLPAFSTQGDWLKCNLGVEALEVPLTGRQRDFSVFDGLKLLLAGPLTDCVPRPRRRRNSDADLVPDADVGVESSGGAPAD
jgi:hypothetical protein